MNTGQRLNQPDELLIVKPPILWLIGGSDSGGAAGIQADLRAVSALGGHGCTLITAITAQNSRELHAVFAVTPAQLLAQLRTLAADLPATAIKIGQVPDDSLALTLANWLAEMKSQQHVNKPPLVIWDPVIYSSSGTLLSDLSICAVRTLLKQVDILTPNLAELAWCTQADRIATAVNDPLALAQLQRLRQEFSGDILLKGGHGVDPLNCTDLWCSEGRLHVLSAPRLHGNHQRGTGCTLASAFATTFALGYEKNDAMTLARAYLQQALRLGYPTGAGAGSLGMARWPTNQLDFPRWQTATEPLPEQLKFARLTQPIGLYPVVDDLQWLIRLLPLGVQTIQLRLKNLPLAELERQIQSAVELCRDYQIQLFINDHWQLALKYQAFGVHLGQEDLASADLAAIARQGMRLGISTHGYAEIARVLPLQPSYIALGHIFATQTKQMPSKPQGIARLRDYVQLCSPLPTVAIGGIDLANIQAVVQTGVRGVAVVSAVIGAPHPEKALAQLQPYCHALPLTAGAERDGY